MRRPPQYKWWHLMLTGGFCSTAICTVSFSGSFVDFVAAFSLGAILVSIQLLSVRNELYCNVFDITIATVFSFICGGLAATKRICYSATASPSIVLILPGFIALCGRLEILSRNIIARSVQTCYVVVYCLFLGFGLAYQTIVQTPFANLSNTTCALTHNAEGPWCSFFNSPPVLIGPEYEKSPVAAMQRDGRCHVCNITYSTMHFQNQADFASAVGFFAIGMISNLAGRFLNGNAFTIMLSGILFQVPSGVGNDGLLVFISQQTDDSGTDSEAYLSRIQTSLQLISVAIGLTIGLGIALFEHQKTQSIAGAGKLIARTPTSQVNRLLILILGVASWAAGCIGCYIGMEKVKSQRYFYELFVITGVSMVSKDFSKVLGSLNSIHLSIDLKLSDFHQLSACMLISSMSTSFFDPDDEDPDVVAAHKSFGHSLDTGRVNHGLDTTSEATGLAADAVAHSQQVSIKWQVFLKLEHPVLEQQVEWHIKNSGRNSSSVNALITYHFFSLASFVDERFNVFEKQTQATIRREIEFMGVQILKYIQHSRDIPSYNNPRRPSVHPAAQLALKAVLRRKCNPSIGFSSAVQAELVNSVGSSLHIFGIIKTGVRKSVAFFGAPFLFPRCLVVVVSPLIALTQDLRRRLLETGLNGGIWNEEPIDIHIAQLVLVSAHMAGTDEFHNWLTKSPLTTNSGSASGGSLT
ncbi:hypothetical protein EV368DRAFT_86897 [Lentinula lateritia]|nr:hypothetical protein EV368DRAFT_86897 [Lentinula lateritia]